LQSSDSQKHDGVKNSDHEKSNYYLRLVDWLYYYSNLLLLIITYYYNIIGSGLLVSGLFCKITFPGTPSSRRPFFLDIYPKTGDFLPEIFSDDLF